MKQVLVSRVAIAGLVAALTGVMAAPALASSPGMLTGSATTVLNTAFGPLRATLSFNAQSGASPSGTFAADFPNTVIGDVNYSGTVSCLSVTGNVAKMSGVVTAANQFIPVGSLVFAEVVDNRGPWSATPADQVAEDPFALNGDCATASPQFALTDILPGSGNYVVRAARVNPWRRSPTVDAWGLG